MTRAHSDPAQPEPGHTYLGFDYGTGKIGIAVGQNLTQTAHGLDTLKTKDAKLNWDQIKKHIDNWQPCALVVGVPLDGAGKETDMSGAARKFGQMLSTRYNLPVHCVNEYLSSVAARQVLSKQVKSRRASRRGDQVAAQLILETFLNEQLKDKNGGVNGDA